MTGASETGNQSGWYQTESGLRVRMQRNQLELPDKTEWVPRTVGVVDSIEVTDQGLSLTALEARVLHHEPLIVGV